MRCLPSRLEAFLFNSAAPDFEAPGDADTDNVYELAFKCRMDL